MINENLWHLIVQTHKQHIGLELYDFLFFNCKPVVVTESRIVIALDDYSLNFLAKDSDNFANFFKSCELALQNKDFYLNFISFNDISKYVIDEKNTNINNLSTSSSHLENTIAQNNNQTINQNNNQSFISDNNLIPNLNNSENFLKETPRETQENLVNLENINNQNLENVDQEKNLTSEMFSPNLNKQLINSEDISSKHNLNNDNISNTNNIKFTVPSQKETPKFEYENTHLLTNLTFDNFFYSYENKQIIDAAKLLIENLDNPQFNPLFIYGASGIGKTHILNAIGNKIYNTRSDKNILYLHSQDFLEEYTSLFKGGIDKTNKIEEFKQKYDNIDILLVDDIQNLETREGSLNEFFGIFEKMRNNNKMVIIASDKHPEKIHFEERLITRFLAGLNCEMNVPDTNTKMEIFYYHAKKRNFNVDEEAANIFIEHSKNVRSLLGYLNAITLYSISNNIDTGIITKKDAETILNTNNGNPKTLTEDNIITIIADYWHVKKSDIRSKKRTKDIVNARHFSAYFLRKKLNQRYEKIAYTLGFNDHTAVINAIKQAKKKSQLDQYKKDFDKLSQILNK